ncbi:hypothetical protein E3O44_12585 [Cryobacterium algoricola]|uniref:YopX protein domain-containing protein n=1 Tax=Cryobacterium algoricola TaxID=1259183 RepID=A0ABY2ID82_9MICO|nr:YopX family protein [Cryobacterium algoricola]TFB85832.1 hypothetical protein E3O44_12585 [Cryobacterium algoricola]
MREIKFRAWDKVNRAVYEVVSVAWSYGDILRKHSDSRIRGDWVPEKIVVVLNNGRARTFDYRDTSNMPRGYTTRDIRDLKLLQYTGLKDKNGVKIYEGDVVMKQGGKRGKIFFYAAGFFWENRDTTMTPLAEFGFGTGMHYEVIGNLYESPELLK